LVVSQPDVLIDARGRLVAVKDKDGQLAVSSNRVARFTRDIWLRSAAQPAATPWPGVGLLRCDDLGCLYKAGGLTIALVWKQAALAEDCRRAEVIVSTVPVRGYCPGPLAVIDRFDLWRGGAHALWLEPDGVRIESVNARRGKRPWVLRRVLRRVSTSAAARPTGPAL
jgi:competence protein ComEC